MRILQELMNMLVWMRNGSVEDLDCRTEGITMELLCRLQTESVLLRRGDDGFDDVPVFARIYDTEMNSTEKVVSLDSEGGFIVISRRHRSFENCTDHIGRRHIYGWLDQPIGTNPQFLEQLSGLTAKFIEGVGELEIQVDENSQAFIVLAIPATEEPPAVGGEVPKPDAERQTCPAGGLHKLVIPITVSHGGFNTDYGTCNKCGAVVNKTIAGTYTEAN